MLRWLAAFCLGVLYLAGARAHGEGIPNARTCVAGHLGTGAPVSVRFRVGSSSFAAFASYDSDGWPSITYAPAYFVLPPVVQTFLSMHECGHLALQTTDEFRANCYAVEQGFWTAPELALIAQSHYAVGRLPMQYGGSGAAFWENTKKTCPQFFQ